MRGIHNTTFTYHYPLSLKNHSRILHSCHIPFYMLLHSIIGVVAFPIERTLRTFWCSIKWKGSLYNISYNLEHEGRLKEGDSYRISTIQQVAGHDKVTRGGGASHNPCLAARKSSWNGLLRAGFLHSASHFDRIQFVPPFNMFAVSVLRCYLF